MILFNNIGQAQTQNIRKELHLKLQLVLFIKDGQFSSLGYQQTEAEQGT